MHGKEVKVFQVKIAAVGKLKESYLREGIQEYTKRLGAYVHVEISEVTDEPCPERLSLAEEAKVKIKEGERLLKLVAPQDYVVLLDREGVEMDTRETAQWLAGLLQTGKKSLVFVIGGSLGVSEAVKARADFCWSFSGLTFPHQLMRLALLEQIYRVLKML